MSELTKALHETLLLEFSKEVILLESSSDARLSWKGYSPFPSLIFYFESLASLNSQVFVNG